MVDLWSLPTPTAVIERSRLVENLDAMQRRAERLGVRLRPHFKTHKCVEIARLQVERGAEGLTVSTLLEADVLARHGFGDITWAFPVPAGALSRILRVASRTRLGLVIDGPEALEELQSSPIPLRVWLKIDCGYHRAGVDPQSARVEELVERIHESQNLEFDGLLTHSGHAYDAIGDAAARQVAEQERSVMVDVAERLRGRGLEVPEVSIGSTPAMTRVVDLTGCSEARPGNYAFFDYHQVVLGACRPVDCALSVLATVISSQPGASHCVVDAGALALSKDGPLFRDGAGRGQGSMGEIWADHDGGILDSEIRLTSLSQEHGKLSCRRPVGERVRILPNHSCLAAACFDEFVVVDQGAVIDRWKVWRGRD